MDSGREVAGVSAGVGAPSDSSSIAELDMVPAGVAGERERSETASQVDEIANAERGSLEPSYKAQGSLPFGRSSAESVKRGVEVGGASGTRQRKVRGERERRRRAIRAND